jgi:hypothetical protein
MAIRSRRCFSTLPLILLFSWAVALAQAPVAIGAPPDGNPLSGRQVRNGTESQARHGDIYGYQLMTERERSAYRERMRAAATDQDRDRLRRQHHDEMQERARERGVTLSGPKDGSGSTYVVGPDSARRSGK